MGRGKLETLGFGDLVSINDNRLARLDVFPHTFYNQSTLAK